MSVLLGIDLGTSSLKAMLLDTRHGPLAVCAQSYPVEIPRPGWAEQNPETWWKALKVCLNRLREQEPAAFPAICAIGLSGQMHGLVLTDQAGNPLRNAILWLDQRSVTQVEEISLLLPPEEMGSIFRNRVSTGFALPSLLWVREREPELLSSAAYLLCPKDFLRLRLTGQAGTDPSDASSTCLFATAEGDWAWQVLDSLHLPPHLFPAVGSSLEVAGTVTSACARETGLPAGIPVVFGCGDHSAQSIGCGAIREGAIIANIGTAGQVSAFSALPRYDLRLRTNTFCHAVPGAFTVFGATLSAGLSLRWARDQLFSLEDFHQVDREAAPVPPGSEGLIWLPYLSGERTPHMDSRATGAFFGVRLAHGRGHFLRAILEGVAFSLRDCLDLLLELGIAGETVLASGGGASSPLWLQILADVFERPVCPTAVREQACLGACLLAGTGTGHFSSLEEACARFCTSGRETYRPDPARSALYRERQEIFRQLYPHTADLMHRLQKS